MSNNIGKVVQVIGPVVDVRFEAGHLPACVSYTYPSPGDGLLFRMPATD